MKIQQDTLTFYRPHTCKANIKKILILFQGPRIWNSLPSNIKKALNFTCNTFKCVIIPFLRARRDTVYNLNTLTLYTYVSIFFSKHTYIFKIHIFLLYF